MFDSYKKPLLVFFAALVSFWIITFLALNYIDYVVNDKYLFGLYGANIWPTLLGLMTLIWLYLYLKKNGLDLATLFALVFAAAISNLIERFIYGGVVDYISIFSLNIFNLADLVIIVVLFIIFIYAINNKKL